MLLCQKVVLNAKGESAMPVNITICWNANAESFENRHEVYFMFTPGNGLTDIDFHSITAREWPSMKSPSPDAVAQLQVAKETSMAEIEEVVRQIAEKGGYQTINITSLP